MALIILCIAIQVFAAFQEMFRWQGFGEKLLGIRTSFGQLPPGEPTDNLSEATRMMALNQGFYNLCLAAGLVASLWLGRYDGALLMVFCLVFMAAAGIFGLLTVTNPTKGGKRSYVTFGAQAVPPILALIMMLV